MFRIRRVYDSVVPANRAALEQVQKILRDQIGGLDEKDILALPDKLQNPLKHGFRSILFVAEKSRVVGFAFLLHEPELGFCYLDYISAAKRITGRGIGGALYQRVRQETLALNCRALFLESLPDDPALSPDPAVRKQNRARLKFYESFGVYPVAGTAYETPVKPGDTDPPFLLYDDLGQKKALGREFAQKAVKAILEKKYHHLCPPAYIETVVASFRSDPIRLRAPHYPVSAGHHDLPAGIPADRQVPVIVNDRHDIHHVRERGYVESPVRIGSISDTLFADDLFYAAPVHHFADSWIDQIHDRAYVRYLRTVCDLIGNKRSVYPYVFPLRNASRPPKELPIRAGYYCIDTFTPLNRNAYLAARRAVDCALSAADLLLKGERLSYALVRPPGHHAERRAFGGFCYFNNAAIAAHYLSKHGKVAILDIDYHHGNGQQDIFYQRSDVLTVSIHGHPGFAYPYFSGFADERGEGEGRGYNINYPLDEKVNGDDYAGILQKALRRIRRFKADFLVIALGLDTARNDPTGSWTLNKNDFFHNGRLIATLNLPAMVIQEGGYRNRTLGVNARAFFLGMLNKNGTAPVPQSLRL